MGIRLVADLDGTVIVRSKGERLFYLFHNNIRCPVETHYVTQKIHKHVENYPLGNGPPEREDLYMVESFKTVVGRLKRPDQHYGLYSLGPYRRRVIVKTFELGEPRAEGEDIHPEWPHDIRTLAKTVHPYQADSIHFDNVRFRSHVRWTIRVEMLLGGLHSLEVPIATDIGYSREPDSSEVPIRRQKTTRHSNGCSGILNRAITVSLSGSGWRTGLAAAPQEFDPPRRSPLRRQTGRTSGTS